MHLARWIPKRSNVKGDESGMMIVQVVIISAVLLGVLLAGFKTVQTTIQAANTVATSAAFKDLVLAVEQNLDITNSCAGNLGVSGVSTATLSAASGYSVSVKNSVNGLTIAEIGKTSSVEFIVTELKLINMRSAGFSVLPGMPYAKGVGPAGKQELRKWAADLRIVAERRSGFLGGKTMTAELPLLFTASAATSRIVNCSTRGLYQSELGPKSLPNGTVRKSGLECVDRGGTPIIKPGTNPPYYVCRLPLLSWHSCGPDPKTGKPLSTLPGWYCDTPFDVKKGFSYAF